MDNIITQLHLTSFTKFRDLNIDFSPKINIIIGENGTGKTHLLKVAYLLSGAASIDQKVDVASRLEWQFNQLRSLFRPIDQDSGRLVRRPLESKRHALISASFSAGEIELKIPSKQGGAISGSGTEAQILSGPPIFIPTKEVMSLVGGMTNPESDPATLGRLFDRTYFDVCDQLKINAVRNEAKEIEQDPRFGNVYEKLAEAIDGKFVFDSGKVIFHPGEYEARFKHDSVSQRQNSDSEEYTFSDTKVTKFTKNTGDAISAHMTAEGMRKLGVIQHLVLNKVLSPGISGPLFWDEPETNMNPKLLRTLVEAILELSRNGQQVILATHDYVLLKWFDLLMDKGKGDHVRFHALYKDTTDGEIKLDSTNDYLSIKPNAIADAFSDLTVAHARVRLGGTIR